MGHICTAGRRQNVRFRVEYNHNSQLHGQTRQISQLDKLRAIRLASVRLWLIGDPLACVNITVVNRHAPMGAR